MNGLDTELTFKLVAVEEQIYALKKHYSKCFEMRELFNVHIC